MILDTCSTIEIIRCYHNISSMYQNAPGPSGHTNVQVVSEAAITELLHGIGSTVYMLFSKENSYCCLKEKLERA